MGAPLHRCASHRACLRVWTGLTSWISVANPPGRESARRWVLREIDRVIPVLEGVPRHRPASTLSIDTYKSATAAAALHAGAEIVNDVSILLSEAWLRSRPAECGVVLMHLRGQPEEWQELPAMHGNQMVALVKREWGSGWSKPKAGIQWDQDCSRPGSLWQSRRLEFPLAGGS